MKLKDLLNENYSSKVKKLNKQLNQLGLRAYFAEEYYDGYDADYMGLPTADDYVKCTLEETSSKAIRQIKSLAKQAGLKFVADLEDMLIFK